MESVISASVIVLIIRTRKPFFVSKPAKSLSIATVLVAMGTIAIPYTKAGSPFGFAPMPLKFIVVLGAVLFVYVAAAEVLKRAFYAVVRF
jgi:Mg2+-importing ATPase